MQAWPLTGRAEELKIVADVLGDDEHAGVVIAGRAGVGKTRLAREAAAAAGSLGWTVRWVVGTAAARSIPLGAFTQWAEGLDANPLQLVRGVITAITASPPETTVVVVVDDVHLLDDLSSFVLHQLVHRRAARVIATVRTGEPVSDSFAALWKDVELVRLDLQPLSHAESDSLLARVLGGQISSQCADQMWRLARGNALFLSQLVKQELDAGRLTSADGHWQWEGSTSMSPSLVDVVHLQIGAVTEQILDVIDLVAVAEPLELEYLSALADQTVIEESERRGVITVSPTSGDTAVRVGHPLFGEVRRAQSARLRLARMRGRIATVMTELAPTFGPPDPVRLALLWLDSDLPPDHDIYDRAAHAAFIRLDLELAQRLAQAAVTAGAGVDVQLLSGFTLSVLSRGEEAEQVLAPLVARRLPDAAWSTAVNLRAGNLLWSLRRPDESWEFIDAARAAASGALTHAPLAFRVMQLASAARPAEALAAFESVDRSGLAALPELMSMWAAAIALSDLGNPLRAAALAEQGAALAAAAPDAAYLAVLLVIYQVQALILGGYVAQAQTVAERAYQQCADVPGQGRATATAIKGVAALGNGDLSTAVECLKVALTEFEIAKITHGISHVFGVPYTQAVALSGDGGAAVQALSLLQRNRHPAHAYLEPDGLVAAGWVAAARGRTSEARALAVQGAEYARTRGQPGREVLCLQAAIQFGDDRHAARLTELMQTVEGPRVALVGRWAAALADDNGEALLALSGDLAEMGDRVAAADAAAHAAVAFGRHGRRGSALTAGGRADRLIAECGAVTPATRLVTAPLPLSGREREIATMVADRLSNKEIAEALTLSVRTVENHIYHVCSKLGVANRGELARLMSESAIAGKQHPAGRDGAR
ncbi:MAG TPA: LuxR C-terminal-related transcriptional regulator [Mycobacterium sp.]